MWSYNVETGELALKVVKEVFVLENGELLHAGAGLLQATPTQVGDAIRASPPGLKLKLKKLDSIPCSYNLNVELPPYLPAVCWCIMDAEKAILVIIKSKTNKQEILQNTQLNDPAKKRVT